MYQFSKVVDSKFPENETKYQGRFLDTNTFALAVTGAGGSLKGLSQRLQLPEHLRKLDDDGNHGKPLKREYIEYAHRDPIATHAVFSATLDIYLKHQLTTPCERIYSGASMGKAYLKKFGMTPSLYPHQRFRNCSVDEDGRYDKLLGIASEAFYGGRADIGYRLSPYEWDDGSVPLPEIISVDFTSQYPTVQLLMRLQDILFDKTLGYEVTTAAAKQLIDSVTIEDLLRRDTWLRMRGFARARPSGHVLPVRSDLDDGAIISNSEVHSDLPLWYSIPDIIASKLLTGRIPEIVEAIILKPNAEQITTVPVDFFGDPDLRVDVSKDQIFQRVIELRLEIYHGIHGAPEDE
ncbi:MAG: hypothetical protein L0287_02355 [Anaerolineae bacterium]|nr:hypothetical protein [Anaerolineae bacterium]